MQRRSKRKRVQHDEDEDLHDDDDDEDYEHERKPRTRKVRDFADASQTLFAHRVFCMLCCSAPKLSKLRRSSLTRYETSRIVFVVHEASS